jgi:hypothetical protein
MATQIAKPDERQFRADVERGAFLLGETRGYWRLLAIAWPAVWVEVAAAPRHGAPTHYVLRFDLAQYPQQAPTARLWDMTLQVPLAVDNWPAGKSRVSQAFRTDWKPGECLYLPCDRLAFEGHPDWPTKYASEMWQPSCDITHYLNQVHVLLNSSDYTGWRRG